MFSTCFISLLHNFDSDGTVCALPAACKSLYDKLMIPPEITSPLGFLMHSPLFITTLKAYQLQEEVF